MYFCKFTYSIIRDVLLSLLVNWKGRRQRMIMDIAIKGPADVEVINHRIYEVRGLRLKSQIVTSCLEMANIENTMRFAVKNFDRKTDLRSRLNNIEL